MNVFLVVAFRVSSLASNNFFLYLLEKFLANDKNSYPSTHFLVVGSIEYCIGSPNQ